MRAFLLAALMIFAVLAGCVSSEPDVDDTPPATTKDPNKQLPPQEAASLPFRTNQSYSRTLTDGVFDILPPVLVDVPVTLPVTEGGAAVDPTNPPRVNLGLWLPDVPEGTKVPVLADIGPYYGDGDFEANVPGARLGAFLVENYVPHGYAVAQVSVFGSGTSNHCFDMFGNSEQLGVQAAVDWLGSQDWSSGNVGVIGKSYDGSTPYMAAVDPSPYLKTIVPMQGLTGLGDLVIRNGSVESRALTFHSVIYGTFGIDGDIDDAQRAACPDFLASGPWGAGAASSGDQVLPSNPAYAGYWEERSFLDRVVDNYEGSVYIIHGFQDWNVDPHMAFPTHQILEAADIPVKTLVGQWGHHYPDRPGDHRNLPTQRGGTAFPESVRYDWAEDLKVWFDYYLKNSTIFPNHGVEVQNQYGSWRTEATYPPTDTDWATFDLNVGANVVPTGQTSIAVLNAFEEDVLIGGHFYLEAQAQPSGPGGQVFVQLYDMDWEGGSLYLGYGIMDLRHTTGTFAPVAPGVAIPLRIQSQALDTMIPANHTLEVRISGSGEGHLPSPTDAPVLLTDIKLKLPVLHREADVFFTPPAWESG